MFSALRSFACRPIRAKPSIPVSARFVSNAPPKSDAKTLNDILDEAAKKTELERSATANLDHLWKQQGERKKFTAGMFTRPHYFTRDHRYKKPPMRPRPALVGPGRREARRQDVFYQLGIDPLHESQNVALLSAFVTEMGKIRPRTQTGLTTKTQRRLGKAIRRAKMMGVIPWLSRARTGHWQR